MQELLVVYLMIINLSTFSVYGVDKQRARKREWRVPERTLLLLALAGGGFGAYMGMRIFRHKTKHMQFQILVPLSVFFWTVLLCYYAFCLPLNY